jgi:hypothetical protein
MERLRGKDTCEAPETAAAIFSQTLLKSGELRFSKASGRPYESNARENAQTRSFVRAMIDPAWAGEQPPNALYIVQKVDDRTNADGLRTRTPGWVAAPIKLSAFANELTNLEPS